MDRCLSSFNTLSGTGCLRCKPNDKVAADWKKYKNKKYLNTSFNDVSRGSYTTRLNMNVKSDQTLVFEKKGKPEYPEKNLSEQSRQQTKSPYIWLRVSELNPGEIGGRVSSVPLQFGPLSPEIWPHPVFILSITKRLIRFC